MYNSLLVERDCPDCGSAGITEIQFKYGNLRRHSYREGDLLVWGQPEIGSAGYRDVLILGIADCARCGRTVWFNLRARDSVLSVDSVHDGSLQYPSSEFIVTP